MKKDFIIELNDDFSWYNIWYKMKKDFYYYGRKKKMKLK